MSVTHLLLPNLNKTQHSAFLVNHAYFYLDLLLMYKTQDRRSGTLMCLSNVPGQSHKNHKWVFQKQAGKHTSTTSARLIFHLTEWSELNTIQHLKTTNTGLDFGERFLNNRLSDWCDPSASPSQHLAPVLALSDLAWHGTLWPCVFEEEARSKAEEQPWKNIWAENGRDICPEAFPTGLTSARAQGSGYHPKTPTWKRGWH